MSSDKLKKSTSKKKTVKSKVSPDLDVPNVESDSTVDSFDILNEEVWEFMNEQDDICYH